MADDLHTLLTAAERSLERSADPAIEALKWRAVEGRALEPAITPLLLSQIAQQSLEWSESAFSELAAGGFIRTHLTAFVWAPSDAKSLSQEFRLLGALEAVAAIRFRYIDCTRLVPHLSAKLGDVRVSAENGEPVELCTAAQRFFLHLIAGMGSTDLLRDYANHARGHLAYAWAAKASQDDLSAVREAIGGILSQLSSGDGHGASKAIAALRISTVGLVDA